MLKNDNDCLMSALHLILIILLIDYILEYLVSC
jgi:hypothetical protein